MGLGGQGSTRQLLGLLLGSKGARHPLRPQAQEGRHGPLITTRLPPPPPRYRHEQVWVTLGKDGNHYVVAWTQFTASNPAPVVMIGPSPGKLNTRAGPTQVNPYHETRCDSKRWIHFAQFQVCACVTQSGAPPSGCWRVCGAGGGGGT